MSGFLVPYHDPVPHVDHPSRRGSEILIVRHDHERRAVAVEASKERDHLGARRRIELARGLVGEEDGGLVRKRHRDRDALLLPS